MADDVSGTSQNTALRDKFVSVVGPVFEGGEEANILTLLTSLANVCRHDEGLVVTAPDTTTNVNEVNGHKSSKALESDKTSEFTCWLIAELVTVEGSETVNKANVNLQVTIMRILATRSPLLFSRVIADYINIGLEGKEVLFEGSTVVCQCFSSVIRRNDAHPVPKTITFVDDSKLDRILTTVVMVLSQLGSFIDQYCWQMMDRVWLLICSCLEGGDEKLKVAALGAVTVLLDSCSAPQSNERLDYLLQCVGALLSSVLEDGGSGENMGKIIKDLPGTHQEIVQKETDNTLPEHLAKVINVLLQHIPSMLPIFQEELLQKTSVCLQKAEGLKRLSETLRAELLKCHCVLFDALASSPCVQDAQEAMYLCAEENIMLKEVSKFILKRIVVKDLLEALPSHAVQSHQQEVSRSQSRKRRLSETESTQPTISVVTISKLWKQALQTMGNVLSDWTDGTSALDLDHVKALGEIICTAGRVITNIPNAQVTLQFFPDSWVTVAADSLATIMAEADNANFVMCLMETVAYMTWTGSVAESSNKKPQNNHIWMALATLPWMASEVSLLDLKPPNTKQYTSWASRLKWGNDSRVKAISISIIAMMPEDIAPKWRCHIMRAAINERDSVVMHEVARWFPVMVHQLGGAGGQQLVGEVVGAVLHFPDNKTVQAGAASLNHLLCALLNHTTVKCPKSEEDTYGPNILVCRVCKNGNSTNNLDPQRVDPTLVSRFLGLLTHSDTKVLVSIIDALPAVITHTKLNPHMINQYLSLLDHQDKQVVSAMCRQLSELVCQGVQSDSSQDLKSALVSKEGELVLSYLNELFRTAERKKSSSKTYLAVLEALHYLVRCPLGGLTGGVLVLLLRCLAISDRLVTAQAHLIIHSLANTLGLPLKDLYIRHRQSLAQVLSEIVRPGEVGAMLSHVAEVFEWNVSSTGSTKNQGKSSVGQFIISQIRHLLPALAVRATQEAKPGLLQELAGCLSLRLRDILIDHFQHILAFLVFHYPQEEQEAVLDFIASTTDIHIQNIRRCSVQNQVNELILGLHDHRDAVLREFSRMRAIEQSSDHNTSSRLTRKTTMENKFSHDPATSRDIAEYLAPRLLGILGFLDSKLVSSSTMYKEKRCALWSLSDLLVVMGRQYISPVSRKILASLKTALKLRDDEFFDIGCSAWTNFLYNLDESTLEGLLEEVAVVVKPLVKERPQQMAPVLTSVLVEMPSIRPLLGNLPLLPEDPALTQVNQAILERQTRVMGGSREEVVSALSPVLRGLSHESLDVRLHALNRLRHILRHNQEAVHHLTTDADTVHPTVSELFSILLGQCREVEEEVQVAVADCLGLLGAIDPMRLYTHSNIKEELSKIHLNIEEELFIVELVTELGRAFLAATDANTQTCASYAMQEVTRVYGIRERGSEGATPVGSGAWDRLPYQMQEIIFPLMTSKYTVANSNSRSTSGRPSPIYGSSRAQTFHQWLTNWTCSLIDLLKGERAFQVFSACKPILRRDTTTAMYLLQPVLVCALRESEQHHETILKEVLAVMKHMDEKPVAEQPSTISLELQHLAVQTLFTALDYVSKWIQKQRQIENASKKGRGAFTPSMELQQVTGFLEKIPANLLAQTSFKCQAYHRAMLHIEAFLKDNPSQLKEHLGFMQRIYVSLDEPDGVAGVAAIRQEDPSLDEQVIQHVATGRLQDALGCYEHLCVRQGSEEVYKGLLDCYLSLDQPHSVLNITHGLLSNKPELEASLNEYRVEAAWRLGKWDCLEKYLETNPNQNSWGSGVGQVLLAVRARDSAAYQSSLRRLRTQQIAPLSAASMEKWAYQRAYPNILRLHILTELEEMVSGLLQFNQPTDTKIRFSSPELKMTLDHQQQPLNLQELVERWDKRLSLVQTSHRYLEPILSFRRTLLELGREWTQKSDSSLSSSLVTRLESSWLHSAKVARKAGHTQQGEWALLGAGSGRDVFIERAKWHWVKGEQHQAVTTLNRGMEKFFSSSDDYRGDTGKETQEERIAYGRAKLLLARYSEESATQEVNTIKQYYRDACEMNKQWEDGHFHLAMYYDRILSSLDVKEKPVEWIHHIVLSFGKSLQYGCRHVYQSMPRMLGLWLEFGTRVSELEAKEEKSRVSRKNTPLDSHREKLANLNGAVGSLVDRLPHYMFMTALPQLISRICHSNNEVFVQLCKIIATMLSSYPQQAMWHMIAVSKSSYPMRVSRCIEIFETAKRKNPDLHKFIADATKLADKFLELSNKHVEKGVPQVSLNSLLRGLPRLLSDTSFSSIILPLQQQMTVTTPVSSDALHSHNPFPRAEVFLASVEDQVEIMQSLQLPKKITLRGSDGNRYIMMCKPKDDLRKDCRLMEFNAFVNRCLVQDPESRRRDLHIRTYAVVPLNEECGLIEWIQNLNGLRQILHRIYRDTGIYMSGQELKQNMCKIDTPLATKRDIFKNKLVPRHPPVFGEWFLRNFPDPQAWLRARLSYCRTTAVMSMVGYILGLGDRHGENILFDSSNGDTVHVDFNCLFNKGETFDWPERVPFRLTHNMISAMGPTGYEGIFRKTCEVTMRVMRDERDALMSILRPFIHDPLVEWSRGDKSAKNTGEINNEKAQMHVSNIEHRLSGQIRTKGRGLNLPLSVEGQVNSLIEEATSVDNLCQMYIGWAAYM
ncbi:serine/threonine-protein kinase ATR-like [Penaeus chinensis]|uniref:serine/threonine-protein kinase ATR-like n=1 Tax=Penaeus chinensis TaxID=139456 RepID=UPI001FB6F264|nr:serine/threonine-protein kinase ATR-like [Penaeus chinensis]